MRLENILKCLRTLAPEHLAEDWDKPGLHVGDPAAAVARAMLCIDLTEPVLDEAIGQRAKLVVAYHPPIFQPLTAVTATDVRQRTIYKAIRKGIAIYSPHTALDAAVDGVNDWLASGLGPAARCQPIRPLPPEAGYKIVTFVSPEHADALRAALAAAGAGRIGDYEQCSYELSGTGTFLGGESTHPTVGRRGQLERVPELRLEMVCPREVLGSAIAALRATQPAAQPEADYPPNTA
jgi:dinuclear metal center YbgI/SA1388 family protein